MNTAPHFFLMNRLTEEMKAVKKKVTIFSLAGILALLALSAGILTAFTGNDADELIVEITITNLTRGQTMTSFFLARREGTAAPLYTLGQAASDSLANMAEDGRRATLLEAWGPDASSSVAKARVEGGLLRPGQSVTITFNVNDGKQLLSLASMLVSINDAFVGADSLDLSTSKVVYLNVYDAGSEANTEDCDHVPGPPCNAHGVSTDTSEGFVHVHAGIHSGVDLSPAQHDWRNPGARLEVKTWKRV